MFTICFTGLASAFSAVLLFLIFFSTAFIAYILKKEKIVKATVVAYAQSTLLYATAWILHLVIVELADYPRCSMEENVEGLFMLGFIILAIINTVRVYVKFDFIHSMSKNVFLLLGYVFFLLIPGLFWIVLLPEVYR